MKRAMMVWLIVAGGLVLLGCCVFVVALSMSDWTFHQWGADSYETNTHAITEEIRDIALKTDTADVLIVPSEDGACRVVCHEHVKETHMVSVTDGVLSIRKTDERKWYEHIGISFGTTRITVYLPAGDYKSLTVKGSTGTVSIREDFSFETVDITASTGGVICSASAAERLSIRVSTGTIEVSDTGVGALSLKTTTGKITVSDVVCEGDADVCVSTGKTELTDLSCRSLRSEGSTGDLVMKNVIAAEKFSIERDTGDVRFDGCDAAEIEVETDTGDVTGTFLSEKVIFVETDTGDKDIPHSLTGGRCEISTDTGDVHIRIQP